MHATLVTLIDRLDKAISSGTDVIPWGCPVPSFGDLCNANVATVGINPSNREFLDSFGNELRGDVRRFHTLQSLGIDSWIDADARHLHLILESCRTYFLGNPYDTWFKKLDLVVSGTGASYYDMTNAACHLDLIPYATLQKWTELSAGQRSKLLSLAGDTLALLLRDSSIQIVILNGRSVVEQFEKLFSVSLEECIVPLWALPRRSQLDVRGIAYKGTVETLAGIPLGREILVLGYNHNLQSSFGVTTTVIHAIRNWVAQSSGGYKN